MSVLPLDQERWMAVKLNHTIVWCRDKEVSASYLAEVLGLEAPRPWGPFLVVEMGNEVSLDFREYYSPDGEIDHQHYAFLVPEDDFDQILGRLTARGQQYWALRHCPRQLRLLQRAGAAPTRAVERARAPGLAEQ